MKPLVLQIERVKVQRNKHEYHWKMAYVCDEYKYRKEGYSPTVKNVLKEIDLISPLDRNRVVEVMRGEEGSLMPMTVGQWLRDNRPEHLR